MDVIAPYLRPAVIGVMIFVAFNALIIASAILVLMERKVMGFMQQRYGPYLVGPHGSLQPIADILKLLGNDGGGGGAAMAAGLLTLGGVLIALGALVAGRRRGRHSV